MSSNITYKGELIAKNSEAFKLWESKDWKKLDKHLAQLDRDSKDLIKRYEKEEK